MIKNLLITVIAIGLITSGRAEDTPTPGLDPSKKYTSEEKRQLGHLFVSIQPYLTPDERKTLSNLVKEGMVRQIMDLGKKETEKAK